jgi:zinc transport system substrate-binding protein
MRLATVLLLILLHVPTSARAEVEIVTSIKPLALLIEDIGGTHVKVTTLVPNAGSIHHYSMRVSDRVAVEQADMVVLVGAGLEPFLDKLARLDSEKILRMDQLPGVEAQRASGGEAHDHEHSGPFDPHLWLSPANSKAMARELSQRLGHYLPAQKDYFQVRLQTFLDAQARVVQTISPSNSKQYFAYHNAFAYLLSPYGIKLQGVLTNLNESRLGMRSLYQVKKAVQDASSVCVLVQQRARDISEKILGDVNYAELDVLADGHVYNSYSGYLAAMLNAINDC